MQLFWYMDATKIYCAHLKKITVATKNLIKKITYHIYHQFVAANLIYARSFFIMVATKLGTHHRRSHFIIFVVAKIISSIFISCYQMNALSTKILLSTSI